MDVVKTKLLLKRNFERAWSELNSGISKIAAGCDVRPNRASDIFTIDQTDNQSIKVVVEPIAFLLKARPQDDKAQLFVTVAGKVNFSIDAGVDPPRACYFATEVGYFRVAGAARLDHILGVHYDHDDRRAAHPVFHAQLTSCAGHLATINQHYQPTYALGTDLMEHVPRLIRLPTAHMDPLAVFLQLLADHLMNENSGTNENAAFEKARKALMFFRSDPNRAKRLDSALAESCFRGPRWYPAATGPLPAGAIP